MVSNILNAAAVIAVAPFGIARIDQHLVDDDAWYAAFLAKHVKQLVYIAGCYSSQRLIDTFRNNPNVSIIKLPEMSNRLAYERAIVRVLAKELNYKLSIRVIFFGYSESMILLASPLLFRKKCNVTLVNTNNISQKRLDKYYWPMRIMHWLLSRRLTHFIVHTEHEKNIAISHFPYLASKITVKKHHMMHPDLSAYKLPKKHRKNYEIIISCFGPITPDKSVSVINAVLRHLTERGQTAPSVLVKIFKVDPEELYQIPTDLKNVTLSFSDEFLEPAVYRQQIKESDLVVMNHTGAFEGKLSGLFCDCIALGIPFLALGIEPLLSFDKHYDGLGFLLPRKGGHLWPERISIAIDMVNLSEMRQKVTHVSKSFEKSALDADYLRAFNL